MRFKFLDRVKIKTRTDRGAFGLVLHGKRTAFGELYWVNWDDDVDTVMHRDTLEKTNAEAPRFKRNATR